MSLRTPLAVALEVMVLDKGCADCEHKAVAAIRADRLALLDEIERRLVDHGITFSDLRREVSGD